MMKIRYGTTDDATMLAELGAQTFLDTFAKDNTAEDMALHLRRSFSPEIQFQELAGAETVFLIAEVDGVPVGYAQLLLNSLDESINRTKPLEIRRIYASQEFLGKGVGKELMQAAISEARQRDCDSVWLGVWEQNQRAINFYKKWGFQEVGSHIFYVGDDPQNDLVLEFTLA
jgi:diamine N-acetyltransferase